MTRSLTGMTVLITGASSGIGAALAEVLAQQGARLALVARRRDKLEALVARLSGSGHLVIPADVADPRACAGAIAQACSAFGRLDTLVCNAGYGLVAGIAATDEEQWLAILRTNLLGTTACIRAAAPLLLVQPLRDGWRGQVMIVSSALARRGRPDAGAYSATKAAQLSVAEALRIEWAEQRIAVTSVHPIHTDTEFHGAAAGRRWLVGAAEPRQTPAHVAARMVAAIRRPQAEVWPHRGSRWALALGALWAWPIDRYLTRRLAEERAAVLSPETAKSKG